MRFVVGRRSLTAAWSRSSLVALINPCGVKVDMKHLYTEAQAVELHLRNELLEHLQRHRVQDVTSLGRLWPTA